MYKELYDLHGSHHRASQAIGISESCFSKRLQTERKKLTKELESIREHLKQDADMQSEKPRIRVKAWTAPNGENIGVDTSKLGSSFLGESGAYLNDMFGIVNLRKPLIASEISSKIQKLIVIGDTHFHPGIDHLTVPLMGLVAKHIIAYDPDHVVHIGDVSDCASVCDHVKNDTYKAKVKPSIMQDLKSLALNWVALNEPLNHASIKAKRHLTKGNHCEWLWKHEDKNPEYKGIATNQFDEIIESQGWTHSQYGEFYYIGGVGFVHVPLSVMGKPVGGEAPESSVAMKSTHDLVFGHTHRSNSAVRTKVGFGNRVQVVNVGGCMPEFYVGDYAQLTAGSAVTSGIMEIEIYDGRIQSSKLITSRQLKAMYG
jgi:hypothetical protein